MRTTTEQFLKAALAASPELRDQAMLILQGRAQLGGPVSTRDPDEPYLTLKGLSEKLGISTTSLWRYRIPARIFGGRPSTRRARSRNTSDLRHFSAVWRLFELNAAP